MGDMNNRNTLGETSSFVSGHNRAKVVGICLTVVITFTCLTLMPFSIWVWLNDHSRANNEFGLHEFMIGLTYSGLGIIFILLLGITFIFFLRWIHRAHANLPSLGTLGLAYSPVSAVIGFCIPGLNLFYPFNTVKEIWKASDPATNLNDQRSWENAPSSPLITFWWILSLLLTLFPFVVYIFLSTTGLGRYDYGGYNIIGCLVLAWCLLLIIEAIMAKRIIEIIDYRQEERHKRILSNSPFDKSAEKSFPLININIRSIFSYLLRWWILPFIIMALIFGLLYIVADC